MLGWNTICGQSWSLNQTTHCIESCFSTVWLLGLMSHDHITMTSTSATECEVYLQYLPWVGVSIMSSNLGLLYREELLTSALSVNLAFFYMFLLAPISIIIFVIILFQTEKSGSTWTWSLSDQQVEEIMGYSALEMVNKIHSLSKHKEHSLHCADTYHCNSRCLFPWMVKLMKASLLRQLRFLWRESKQVWAEGTLEDKVLVSVLRNVKPYR